jgi:3-hydroxybutyrate dehydrogenase
LAKPAEIKEACAKASELNGVVDILVNNAGIQHIDRVDDFPDEKWQLVLDINLSAAFYTTKALITNMREQKWGRIINMASIHGRVASPFKPAYVSAKFGMVGLTKATALEAAEDGITCNAICPGWVKTELAEAQVYKIMKETGKDY